MAKRRKSGRKGRKMGGKSGPFARAARFCWAKLRAGNLPKKGDFKRCMKSQL